jgi:hypothetical protein
MRKYYINGRVAAVTDDEGNIYKPDDTGLYVRKGEKMDPSDLSHLISDARKAGTIEERDGSGRRLLRRR